MRKIEHLMILTSFFPVVLSLCIVLNVQATSIDCDKAATKIEKIICADTELSKLDVEMATAYPKAMKKAPDPVLLKQHQQAWFKKRNECQDISCMKDQYRLRIGELNRIISLVPLNKGAESHYFKTEAEKLKVMQDVVRRQGFVFSPSYMDEPAYCTQFMEDFIAGRHFEAIEPEFRTNDENDPRFARFNRCLKDHPEREDWEKDNFYVVGMTGGPPYRYYYMDVDGNPENGKEEVIYHEWHDKREGGTGYTWVDADGCKIKGGTGAFGILFLNQPKKLYRLNILVRYKGVPMSLAIFPSYWPKSPITYRFRTMRFIDKPNCFCNWGPELKNDNMEN